MRFHSRWEVVLVNKEIRNQATDNDDFIKQISQLGCYVQACLTDTTKLITVISVTTLRLRNHRFSQEQPLFKFYGCFACPLGMVLEVNVDLDGMDTRYVGYGFHSIEDTLVVRHYKPSVGSSSFLTKTEVFLQPCRRYIRKVYRC